MKKVLNKTFEFAGAVVMAALFFLIIYGLTMAIYYTSINNF